MRFEESAFLDNREGSVTLRRSENNLIILGMGIMLFGFWNLAKTVGIVFLNKGKLIDAMQKEMAKTDLAASDELLFATFLIVVGLILVAGIAARLLIGFSSIAVGRYGRRKKLYLPVTVIYIFASLYEIYLEAYDMFIASGRADHLTLEVADSPLVSIIIEITSVIMMIELVVISMRIRKIKKDESDQED